MVLLVLSAIRVIRFFLDEVESNATFKTYLSKNLLVDIKKAGPSLDIYTYTLTLYT